MLEIHSTRLFPKDRGANRYRISGIAARCDWIILSDKIDPQTHLVKRHATRVPETVFLSFRWQRAALRFFVETVLPQLTTPFTLISGSEDSTIPNQIDKRMQAFNGEDQKHVATILAHPNLKSWVTENLDDASHPKLKPLPLGMVFNDDPPIRESVPIPTPQPLANRPLRALCGHRVRPGGQWSTRRRVTELAQSEWQDFCTVLDDDLSETAFIEQIESHAFVICAQGGGLDPSPKAWLSLLHGAVPIIKHSALDEAYKHLPVVFVDDWIKESLSVEKLSNWRNRLVAVFDQPAHRRTLLKRLSLDYWWSYAMSNDDR